MQNTELAGLIHSVAAGDAGALEKIFIGMKDAVFTYALTYVKSRAAAEDVLQDTMLKVWRNAKDYKNSGSARAWVLVIARNTAVDAVRRVSREIPFDDGLEETALSYAPDEARGELAGMLEQLAPADRRIVLLHAVAGLKHREAAKLLNLPLGTVCRRYAQSVSRLRRLYEAR